MLKKHLSWLKESHIFICFLGGLLLCIAFVDPITKLLFNGKNFAGRNLYFQILFFSILTILFSGILFFLFSNIKNRYIVGIITRVDAIYEKNWRLIFLCLFAIFSLLFLTIKRSIFNVDFLRIFKDTTEYVTLSSLPFFSREFFTGNRTIILPLFYKMLGVTIDNYWERDILTLISNVQFWINSTVWICFSYVVSLVFKNHFMKILSSLFVFLLSLGLSNSMWEKLILSESLSNSLFILLLIFFLLHPFVNRNGSKVFHLVYLSMILISALLYAFVRDVNSYFLFFAGAIILFIGFVDRKMNRKSLFLQIGIIFLFSFCLSWLNSNKSTRWVVPLAHVLEDRKEEYSVLAQYYSSKGIDLFSYFPSPETATRTSMSEISERSLSNLSFMGQAKNLYMKFLLSHPKYLVSIPKNQINWIISPDFTVGYRYDVNGTPDWVTKLNLLVYPIGNWIYLLTIIFLGFTIVGRNNNNDIKLITSTCLFLVFSTIPLGLLIWHADTMEIQRHSVQLLIQSRMAFWISLLCFLDTVVNKLTQKSQVGVGYPFGNPKKIN